MIRELITRACPTCGPVADFRRELGREYRCTNCGHTVELAERKPRLGGRRQTAKVDRIRELLAERYDVTSCDDQGHWAERGTVALKALGKQWYQEGLLVYVGPRGALRLTVCTGAHAGDYRGQQAEIWLSVFST